MPRPKITCPEDETPCLEVRWVRGADVGSAFKKVAMYPKPIPVDGAADHSIEPVPDNSQFVYDPEREVLAPRPGGELRLHVQVVGSPGAGKSALLTRPLAVQHMEE